MNNQLLFEIGILILAYLYGSIPFAVILGKRFKGIDVRRHGSGNPGGTNSIRWLGKRVGFSIVVLDVIKGGIIVLLIRFGVIQVEYFHPMIFGVVAAFGHAFSIFIGFKGGKAVGTTVGMALAYNFIWSAIAMVVFFVVIKVTKYVSIGSTSVPIVLLICATVSGLIQYYAFPNEVLFSSIPYIFVLLLLIVFRHRSNYKNISNGIEPKVKWASKTNKKTS